MNGKSLSILSSEIVKQKVEQFFVENLKCRNVEISVENGSNHGDNFIGIVYRVTGESNECANQQKLTIYLKVAPTNKSRREKFFSRPAFVREIYVFTEVELIQLI